MKNLSIVAAIGKNNELGLDNRLIWKIYEDLCFYRKITIHKNIIMGRKTFESMPYKALEERTPIVLSSRNLGSYYDIASYNDIIELLKYVEANPNEEFVVVGGAMVYEDMMPFVDTMYLTEIDDYADADTFFPNIDMEEWDVEQIYSCDERDYTDINKVPYVRNKYVRKRVK